LRFISASLVSPRTAVYSEEGKKRSPERHYDTSSLEAIKALPVAPLAARDCVLFLWCVWPQLPGALEVVKAWGFEYKTAGFVWLKQNPKGSGLFTGMGYWTRANSELCLLATWRAAAHGQGRPSGPHVAGRRAQRETARNARTCPPLSRGMDLRSGIRIGAAVPSSRPGSPKHHSSRSSFRVKTSRTSFGSWQWYFA
jgi:N6-adenosine-specific RNA methylase IME4